MKKLFLVFITTIICFMVSCGVQQETKDKCSFKIYQDNTCIYSTELNKGETAEEIFDDHPMLGIKYGYISDGYYCDQEFTEKFDFTIPIEKNTNVYLKMEKYEQLENLIFELSEDGTYYSIVGSKKIEFDDSFDHIEFFEGFDQCIIPSTYNGLPVKSLEKFNSYSGTVAIYYENISNLELIDEYAFEGADYVVGYVPSSVKYIEGAFRNLEYVKLIFSKDSQLEEMEYTFADSNVDLTIPGGCKLVGAFAGCRYVNINYLDNYKPTVIYEGQFADAEIDSYEIVESIKKIEECAFKECRNLNYIVIPSQVEYIGAEAFSGCTGIEEIIFAKNSKLTYIGENAFDRTHIETIEIPSSVKGLDYDIFGEAYNLESIYFDGTIDVWGEYIETYNLVERFTNIYVKEQGKYVLVN